MIIVGGTYTEICFEPYWENIYGSAFRAAILLLNIDRDLHVELHTCADEEVCNHLQVFESNYTNLTIHIEDISKSPEFHYDHPLRTPVIVPRLDRFADSDTMISVSGEKILGYGMIESKVLIEGNRVVYDPQSPENPKSFRSTGSSAQELVTIVNFSEAQIITGTRDIQGIKDFFLKKEDCVGLVIKMGAQGALLFQKNSSDQTNIPVYETPKVWNIGSGDVFSAVFAYRWLSGESMKNSALQASRAVAEYVNSRDLLVVHSDLDIQFPYREMIIKDRPKGTVYLAGPFFTFQQRWLIHEIWKALKNMSLAVFSPFHDVGHGKAIDVVEKDIVGLMKADVVLAVVDGLDSGTMFELGYARANGKKVVAYTQNERNESIKMLEGTNCIIEDDLTSAIYKTYWTLVRD